MHFSLDAKESRAQMTFLWRVMIKARMYGCSRDSLTGVAFAIVVAENEETSKDDDEICDGYENRRHGGRIEERKSCSLTWSSLDVLADV